MIKSKLKIQSNCLEVMQCMEIEIYYGKLMLENSFKKSLSHQSLDN